MLFKIQPNNKIFHSEFILLSAKNYIKAEAFFIFYENLFNFVSSTHYTAHEFNFFKLSYLLSFFKVSYKDLYLQRRINY